MGRASSGKTKSRLGCAFKFVQGLTVTKYGSGGSSRLRLCLICKSEVVSTQLESMETTRPTIMFSHSRWSSGHGVAEARAILSTGVPTQTTAKRAALSGARWIAAQLSNLEAPSQLPSESTESSESKLLSRRQAPLIESLFNSHLTVR